jgi:hypothetical protein
MEVTIPKNSDSDYQLEIDILRGRWTRAGISFTEDDLKRAVRANAKSRLKKQAEAEFSDEEDDEDEPQPEARSATGRSAISWPDKSDATDWDFAVADINDAWQQYDEEKQQRKPPEEAAAEPDEPEPEEPEPQPEPTVEPSGSTGQCDLSHGTRRRPRRTAQARTLPHRNSTGVWIPRQVWLDARFQSTDERILYLEVNHLDRENGCVAKNKHFADYLGCSPQTVQDMIHLMTMRDIFISLYPSRTTRILHIAGGRRSYPRHRG